MHSEPDHKHATAASTEPSGSQAFIRRRRVKQVVMLLVFTAANVAAGVNHIAAAESDQSAASARLWPGTDFPLPLQVHTPEELAFKALAERHYLVFNLLTSGKLAFDQGNYELAVAKWESLMALEGVDAATRNVVAPLLKRAKNQAPGAGARASQSGAAGLSNPAGTEAAPADATPTSLLTKIMGTVSGGGRIGPGAAVVWLKRADGPTPLPRPAKRKVVNQKDKVFIPHVLAIPLGTEVAFRNDDEYYHNVFSISEPAKFDTGLYKSGAFSVKRFSKPGPVQLLCNIHSNMLAYLYVVDSPYYTQPNAQGVFKISGVPPGRYDLMAWHESSSNVFKRQIEVGVNGVRGIALHMPADEPPVVSLPDKYGKPRQAHLGY